MTARGSRHGGPAVVMGMALWLGVSGCLMGTAASATTVSEPPGVTVDETALSTIDAYLARQREEHGWPGLAAALVTGGEVAWSAGYGTAGPDGQPVTPQTPFLLASVSKSLTAVAVMRLVDAGVLALGDPVSEHVPELAPHGDGVTLRDLMAHRSGLGEALDLEDMAGDPAASLSADLDRVGADLRDQAEFTYTNANYDTLALVVERAANRPFEQVLRDEVFGPLDMATSTTEPTTARDAGLADGHYHWLFAGYRRNVPPLPDSTVGSYRMFASAEDVAHALAMHVSDGSYGGAQVLSPESLSFLHTGEPVAPDVDARYGGGLFIHPPQSAWMSGPSAAYRFIEHDGSAMAYRSYIWVMPELGLGLVLLANGNDWSDESPLPQVGFNVRQILLDEEVTPVTSRSDALQRWGKHLFALLAVAHLAVTLTAIRPVRRLHAGRPAGRGGRAVLAVAAVLTITSVYALARLAPDVADAPLRVVVAQAPDARIIVAVMVATTCLAVVLAIVCLASLRTRRPAHTSDSGGTQMRSPAAQGP
ncbi:MAG: serine hydrolase domain-containing protein [Dermatophilaceae bacterium]